MNEVWLPLTYCTSQSNFKTPGSCSGFGADPSFSESERKRPPVALVLPFHDLLTFLQAVGLNPI